MNKLCGIYCIKNVIDGKVSVGSSINIKQRWAVHKSKSNNNKHSNLYFQRAWNKYGEDSFEFYILEECKESELIDREEYWQNKYSSRDRSCGYNIAYPDRHVVSDETKKKISESHKGKKLSESHKINISKGGIGLKRSEETKQNISNALKGHKGWMSGKKLSEEQKLKISKAHKGRVSPTKGMKYSEETKQKMRESWLIRKLKNKEI